MAWIAFYDFCNSIGVPYSKDDREILDGWMNLGKSTGWWCAFEDVCFCFERPSALHIDSQGRLHCENGPAMAFHDTYEIYCLNGVQMKKEHVMTRAEELDPKLILSEENVEVRRELIRKIGVERFIQVAGARELDKMTVKRDYETEYSLLSVDLSNELKNQKFLKMLNPSVGTWHVEGVPPDCKTVRDAIHARKPKKLRDITVDDENGEDYVQQGDVVMWPREAKSVKFMPSMLT